MFEEGHQAAKPSPDRRAYVSARPRFRSAILDRFTRETAFEFDMKARSAPGSLDCPALVQDGASKRHPADLDRTQENLGSSDAGIAMTRRLLLEPSSAYPEPASAKMG